MEGHGHRSIIMEFEKIVADQEGMHVQSIVLNPYKIRHYITEI